MTTPLLPVFLEDIFKLSFTAQSCRLVIDHDGYVVHCIASDVAPRDFTSHLNILFSPDRELEYAFMGFRLWAENINKQQIPILSKDIETTPGQAANINMAALPQFYRSRINEIIAQHDVQAVLKNGIMETHYDPHSQLTTH